MTQIVETVTATSLADLRRRRDAVTHADLVELRVDGVTDLDVAGALAGRTRPVIFTCRASWEGGRFEGDEAQRQRLYAQAVAHGAEYVDIERRADWRPETAGTRTRRVISDHDFAGVPDDLADRLRVMRAEGADVVKVAVQTPTVREALRLRGLAGGGTATVVIGMGAAGQVTRLLPAHFGSCWTYGGDAAPGQVPARLLRERYRVHATTAATTVYGVAGSPIAHSASPAMHNAALQAAGLDAVYVPVLAATADEAADLVAGLGLAGLSLTAPIKGGWTGRPGVTADDVATQRLGVANTLKVDDGAVRARNFDPDACVDALDQRQIRLAGTHALIVGAGGAARAATFALLGRGVTVSIAARRREEAARLAASLGVNAVGWPPTGRWDLLVNTTPCGTWPAVDDAPVVLGGDLAATVVYDLIYNPGDTALLRAARAQGAVTVGGLDMLVAQAVRQFEWWTGRQPPPEVMRAAARAFVQEHTQS